MKRISMTAAAAAGTIALGFASVGVASAQSKFQCAPGETYVMNVMVSAHPYWVPVYQGFKQAAEAMGVDPGCVFKTLMAEVDGKPVCVVVPSDEEVNMKKLAAAFGGKTAQMMKPADAERLTGYKVGGISPFGQRKAVPTCVEELVALQDRVYLNGGQRGLQINLAPDDLVRALGGKTADLIR